LRDIRFGKRLVPCTGGIALTRVWAALPADLPVSVEVPNEPLRRSAGTHQWLAHLADSTRNVLAEAAQSNPDRKWVIQAARAEPPIAE
jgi:hypothetical protein